MVLCDSEIRAALSHGAIVIDPAPQPDAYTTTAVDLTLGPELFRWDCPRADGEDYSINPAHPGFNYTTISGRYLRAVAPDIRDGSYVLQPKQFVLGMTRERIELPIRSHLAARVEGRSTLARLGIGIHVTAPTIHGGFRGRITLEITNQGEIPIRLVPGLRICQLVFEIVYGTPSADMQGTFQDQRSITGGADT
jgi:dCTP deaminase